MSSKRLVVELFYDVVSPYSYYAFEALCRHRSVWNMDLKLRPFFLGGVMKASGNKPPVMVPNKGLYMQKDLQRLSRYYQVPLKMPDFFVDFIMTTGTIQTMRFITALDMKEPELVEEVSRAFWKRLYEENLEIGKIESISEVGKKCGIPENVLNDCLESMKSDAVKNRLKAVTQEAVQEHGAFGAPTMVAHIDGKKEMYFGCDRLELLAFGAGRKWNGPVPKL